MTPNSTDFQLGEIKGLLTGQQQQMAHIIASQGKLEEGMLNKINRAHERVDEIKKETDTQIEAIKDAVQEIKITDAKRVAYALGAGGAGAALVGGFKWLWEFMTLRGGHG